VRNVSDVYLVRVFPYPSRIQWFADHGMPQSDVLLGLARTAKTSAGRAPLIGVNLGDPGLAPLARWIRADGTATYVRWLLTHPDYVLTEPFRRPERTYNNADGQLAFYAAHDRTDAPLLTTLLSPDWFFALAATLATVGGAVVTGVWRRRDWQIVALLGGLGLAHVLIAWHGDGMEATRHASVGDVQARLAVLVALVMLLPRRPGPACRRGCVRGTRIASSADATWWGVGRERDQPGVSISPR
jgi:hypothetical protein